MPRLVNGSGQSCLTQYGSDAISLSVYPRAERSFFRQSLCGWLAPATPAASSAASVINALRSAIFTCGSVLLPSAPATLLEGPQTPTESMNASSSPTVLRSFANPTPAAVISILVAINATANRFIAPVLQVWDVTR